MPRKKKSPSENDKKNVRNFLTDMFGIEDVGDMYIEIQNLIDQYLNSKNELDKIKEALEVTKVDIKSNPRLRDKCQNLHEAINISRDKLQNNYKILLANGEVGYAKNLLDKK